ncbi:NFAT activation molecule 1 isoform X6 [Rattus norvegicus]|uniref:NFAT activation molecule 1 isoform X6 n=1 Tax=Rattus norvegicus TaxID=10116 RepID=UPI0019176582|nr:NFAT activation molecule 1 isoform X5 [Rattus norvegicus]
MASAVWGPGGISAPLQPAPSRVLPPFLRLLLVPWTLQLADTGYQPPSFKVQEALLLSFTGLLSVLGVLGTALLFWKKKQIAVLGKHTAKTCPSPKPTIGTTKPPAESIYTSLQRRETEVYACIEGETGSPVSSQSPDTKEKMNRVEDDREFNLVYENL